MDGQLVYYISSANKIVPDFRHASKITKSDNVVIGMLIMIQMTQWGEFHDGTCATLLRGYRVEVRDPTRNSG